MVCTNSCSMQVILETAHKIDKNLQFKREHSNVVTKKDLNKSKFAVWPATLQAFDDGPDTLIHKGL